MRKTSGTGIRRVSGIRHFATLLALTAVLSGGMLIQSENAEAADCRTITNYATGVVQYCYEGRQWVANDVFYDQWSTFNHIGSLGGTLRKVYWWGYASKKWFYSCTANNGGFGWNQVSCPF